MTSIIPGDELQIQTEDIKTTIGPGIYRDPHKQDIKPVSAGIFHAKTNKQGTNQLVYIDSNSKRYIPQVNDFVIGVVTGVIGENYKVSLQDFSVQVQLPMMAFANATRKNRPNLKSGDTVYARVAQANPLVDIVIECFDATTGKEGGFGLLDASGFVFDVNLNFARELLFNPDSLVLEKLSSRCKFEIAIGINGKIWIKCGDGLNIDTTANEDSEENSKNSTKTASDLTSTILASRYIQECQSLPSTQLDDVLSRTFKGI